MNKNKHYAISIGRRLKLSFYSMLTSFFTIICAALIYYNYSMKQYEQSVIENNLNYCSILSQSISGSDYEYLFGRPFPGIKSSYYWLSQYFNTMMSYSPDVLEIVTIHKDMNRNSQDDTIYIGLSGELNPISCMRLASYYFDFFIYEEDGQLVVFDDTYVYRNEYPFLFHGEEMILSWRKEKEAWVFYFQQEDIFSVMALEQDGIVSLSDTYKGRLNSKAMLFYQYFLNEMPLSLYVWWGMAGEPIYPPGQPYIANEEEFQWIKAFLEQKDFVSGYALFKELDGKEPIYTFVHVIKNDAQENVGLLKTSISYAILEGYRRTLLKNLIYGSAIATLCIGIINWIIYKYFVFDSFEALMQGMYALLEDQKVDEKIKAEYDTYLFTEDNIKIFDYMKELKTEVLKDPLTGAYNRKFLNLYMTKKIEAYHTSGSLQTQVESIFLLDLDHFKVINDTYGHDMGDQVLKKLVQILETLLRKEDYIVRYGGEEFVIISMTPPEQIPFMLERIRSAIEEQSVIYHETSAKDVKVTASIGCAPFPLYVEQPDFLDIHEHVHLADLLMYRAKLNGRNGYSWLYPLRKPVNKEEKKAMLASLEIGIDLELYKVHDGKVKQ